MTPGDREGGKTASGGYRYTNDTERESSKVVNIVNKGVRGGECEDSVKIFTNYRTNSILLTLLLTLVSTLYLHIPTTYTNLTLLTLTLITTLTTLTYSIYLCLLSMLSSLITYIERG
ncbi:hypothetical protein LCGC14_1113100 [marine sediment metagenome]|uniref:Uncharacterized protein n=1 Tax=marine sediment metagenome TaxID=412755 RepID=A0A0F9MAX3_9ZZZZ